MITIEEIQKVLETIKLPPIDLKDYWDIELEVSIAMSKLNLK